MTNPPAFQLYAADFLVDTADWTVDELGIYFRLLMNEWVNGKLPNDEKRLARIAGTSSKKFQKRWGKIKIKFHQNGDGFLYNRRLEEEREKQNLWREKSRLGGLKSGKARRRVVQPPYEPKGQPKGNSSSSSSSPKNKDTPNGVSFCSEPEKAPASELFQPVMSIPLIKKDGEFHIREPDVREWQETFPGVDVMMALKRIRQWNIDNPVKRKTKRGIRKHISGWLAKAQDKGEFRKEGAGGEGDAFRRVRDELKASGRVV